jgi:two-component system response regulator PilR (NtrC family)
MRRVTVTCGGEKRALCLGVGESVRLGAAADNDLVAPFPGVSRRHARLESTADGVLVVDLGSKNGLVSEGRRFENLLLTDGRQVHLGHAVVSVEEVSSSDLDLGLRFEPRRLPTPASGIGVQDTREMVAADALTSPGAALRLVRRLGRTSTPTAAQRQELMDEARRVLQAQWLAEMEVEAESGELSTRYWQGPLADEETLAALEATLASEPPERQGLRRVETERHFVLASPGDGAWLGAAFDPRTRPAPWAEELLGFLTDRLLGERPAIPDEAPPGLGSLDPPEGMVIGDSHLMRDLLLQIASTLRSDLCVLLSGETGSGKEMVAKLIHRSSATAGGPFLAVNCAAIPGELLEAELFGVEARVATGVDPRSGLFVAADGGTLFLDEIGDMPERLQAKLLRVLQEREVWPLGSSEPRPVTARVIAASNRALEEEVAAGRFRRDLFYRLRGLHFHVPPLRRRREDLPALIHELAARAAEKYSKRIAGVTRRALERLLGYDWPGNVRELEHALERAVLLCPSGMPLEPEHFAALAAAEDDGEATQDGRPGAASSTSSVSIAALRPDTGSGSPSTAGGDGGEEPGETAFRPLQERVDEVERQAIREALAAADGVKTHAAELLGVTRNGLALKMKRLGLEAD